MSTRQAVRAAQVIAVGAVLVLLHGAAVAGERAGIRMPDTIEVAKQKLILNGLGVREATILKVNVYVAGLYLPERSKNPGEILDRDDIKVLHMRFVRGVDRDDVVSAFSDGFKNNAGDAVPALRPRIRQLESWLPSFADGDTLTMTYVPGKGTFIAVNGRSKGTIEGADFARALFAIWLGPKPPNSGLKRGLLGS